MNTLLCTLGAHFLYSDKIIKLTKQKHLLFVNISVPVGVQVEWMEVEAPRTVGGAAGLANYGARVHAAREVAAPDAAGAGTLAGADAAGGRGCGHCREGDWSQVVPGVVEVGEWVDE